MPLLLSAVAVLIPLVIAPGVLFYFDVTPKVFILLVGTAAALLAVPHRKIQFSKLSRRFVILLGICALSLVVSTAGSTDWRLSLIGTNWRRFGSLAHVAALLFAGTVMFTLAGRPDSRLMLLRSIAAGGLVISAYGTLQYFGFDPWLPTAAYTAGEGEWAIIRPPATLGHASYAATYYLFALFVGLGVARADSTRVWRIMGASAAALGSVALVLSGTRAGVLGLVAGAVAFVLLSRRLKNAAEGPLPGGRGSVGGVLAKTALGLVVLALLVVFYYSPAGERLRARARWSMEDAHGGARLLLWRDSLRMAAARPVLGWGPETFSREFPKFQSKELAQAYPDFYHESPHNIFLDSLVSTGVLGLAALIGLCGFGFQAARIASKEARVEATALVAALTAGIVAQQFTSFTVPTAFYLYLTIAILISMTAGDRPVATGRSWAGVLPAVLFIAFAVRLAVSDHHLLRARQAVERSDLASAAFAFGQSARWQRPGPSSDLWYSRALAASAQKANLLVPGVRTLQEGYRAAERAVETAEDRHNAYYNLASYCALRNDFPGVEASLLRTIDQAPNWFKPHWTLAQSLQLAGRLDEAEREAALAVELAGGKYPEVARTLKEIQEKRGIK